MKDIRKIYEEVFELLAGASPGQMLLNIRKGETITILLNYELKNFITEEAKQQNKTRNDLINELIMFHFLDKMIQNRFEKMRLVEEEELANSYAGLVALQSQMQEILESKNEMLKIYNHLEKKNKNVLKLMSKCITETNSRLKKKTSKAI